MKKFALLLSSALLPAPYFPALAAQDAPAPTGPATATPATTAPATTAPATTAPATTAPTDATVDPSAEAALTLLDKAAAAYAALDGLSMKWTSLDDQAGKASRSEGTVAFDKSGRSRVTNAKDGANTAVADDLSAKPEAAKTALGVAMQRLDGSASVPLSALVQGKNPWRDSSKIGWKDFHLLPENGVGATTSPMRPGGPEIQWSFYFDPTDNLLRRVEVKARVQGKIYSNISTLSDLQLNPTFAPNTFTPPKEAPVERAYYDPKLLVGVKPYALSGADLKGKPLNLGAYKGKFVLLDFWATWCGPCVGELPNVLSNYGKYHAKGFDIVGVSLDEDKKSLTDFIAARKMPWPQLFDGKGWQNVNSTRYGVRAIPFTLLIGKDGRIAAVNPRGEELEPALKKALAK